MKPEKSGVMNSDRRPNRSRRPGSPWIGDSGERRGWQAITGGLHYVFLENSDSPGRCSLAGAKNSDGGS
jgi:hypothetical protein